MGSNYHGELVVFEVYPLEWKSDVPSKSSKKNEAKLRKQHLKRPAGHFGQ